MKYPRILTDLEKSLLFAILPESKIGYLNYRNKIEKSFVVREGRWGINNFYLSSINEYLNEIPPSAPVLSFGKISNNDEIIDVVIHEDQEDLIEVDINYINIKNNFDITSAKVDSLAYWSLENENNYIPNRKVVIKKDEYLLIIFLQLKKIILNEIKSGLNYTIPVTNFFNELHRLKKNNSIPIKNPDIIFTSNEVFKDEDFYNAFVNYNNYMRRFNFNITKFATEIPKKKNLFNIIFNKEIN